MDIDEIQIWFILIHVFFYYYYQTDAPYDISQEDGWIKIVNRTPSLINAFQLFCDLTCLKALVFPYFHLYPLLWHTLLGSCRIFVAIFRIRTDGEYQHLYVYLFLLGLIEKQRE